MQLLCEKGLELDYQAWNQTRKDKRRASSLPIDWPQNTVFECKIKKRQKGASEKTVACVKNIIEYFLLICLYP